MEQTEFIWMNGAFIKWDDATVHVLSHALHYGSGAFEGIKCYKTEKGTAIFRLKDHVARMLKSFAVFGIACPYTQEQIEQAIIETVRKNNLQEGYIRPILFFGYGEMGLKNIGKCEIVLAIACWPWGAYLGSSAVNTTLSEMRRISPKSFKTEAKITGHYVNSILASLAAKKAGYHEAIMLDDEGNVAEGPGENIFIVKNNEIYTPALGSILSGITRNTVSTIAQDMNYTVQEKKISVKELKEADECFFTGTAAEVTPIGTIDDAPIGSGKGEVTAKLMKEYLSIVHGESKKYEHWLTYVKKQ